MSPSWPKCCAISAISAGRRLLIAFKRSKQKSYPLTNRASNTPSERNVSLSPGDSLSSVSGYVAPSHRPKGNPDFSHDLFAIKVGCRWPALARVTALSAAATAQISVMKPSCFKLSRNYLEQITTEVARGHVGALNFVPLDRSQFLQYQNPLSRMSCFKFRFESLFFASCAGKSNSRSAESHIDQEWRLLTEPDPARHFGFRLQTPQVPPSLAQCLQYLQFLQALHGVLP